MKNTLISIVISVFGLFQVIAQPILPNVPPKTNASVSLAWNLPTNTNNIVAYMLRRGVKSFSYDEMMRVDGRLTTSVTWSNIIVGVTNYFSITSVSLSGLESDYSNEISLVMEKRPFPPNLQTAVPLLTVIESKGSDGIWRRRLTSGPFYAMTTGTNEIFRVRMVTGTAIQLLPE